MKLDNLTQISSFIKSEGELLVVTHIFPDGDAIGSLLAFGGILDQLSIPYILALDDSCPDKYRFMPGFERIRNLSVEPLNRHFPRVAILDAGALPRIGSAQECIGSDTRVLNIDHHYTGKDYGQINHIDVNASATCELLYDLCCHMGIEMTAQVAYGLYVGILTDTGRFRFLNTNARAFSICGKLVACGVNPSRVIENIYYNMHFEMVKLLAHVLSTMELHHDGMVCLITLDKDHYLDDTEGFVVYPSSVRGVLVSAFMSEMEDRVFKVSLRSRCRVDVSEIARRMSGGGHRKAAGFKYSGTLDELRRHLLTEIGIEIEEHKLKPGEEILELSPDDIEFYSDWHI